MNTSINKTTGAVITAYTNAANTLHGKLTRVCDALIADGHTDLTLYSAPAKDAERFFYDSLVDFVVKGLPAREQALLAMPTKELTQEQKDKKREVGMKKGRNIGHIRNAMTKRLQREAGKGAQTPKSDEAKMVEALAAIAKRASKKEAAPYDTVAFINAINGAIKILAK